MWDATLFYDSADFIDGLWVSIAAGLCVFLLCLFLYARSTRKAVTVPAKEIHVSNSNKGNVGASEDGGDLPDRETPQLGCDKGESTSTVEVVAASSRRKKSYIVAYTLYLCGATASFHLLYLGRDAQWTVHVSTCGVFLIGHILDFFRIIQYVREANKQGVVTTDKKDTPMLEEDDKTVSSASKDSATSNESWGVNLYKWWCLSFSTLQAAVVAYIYDLLFNAAFQDVLPSFWLVMGRCVFRSIGVCLCFSFWDRKANWGRILISTAIGELIHLQTIEWAGGAATHVIRGYLRGLSIGITCLSGVMTQKLRQTMATRHVCTRMFRLMGVLVVLWTLIISALLHNIEIPGNDEELPPRKLKEVLMDGWNRLESSNDEIWDMFEKILEDQVLNAKFEELFEQLSYALDGSKRSNDYMELGVKEEASGTEIRAAYRNLALQYHPDHNPTADASEKMQRINEAYVRLTKRGRS